MLVGGFSWAGLVLGQTIPSCIPSNTTPQVHVEGLSERVGDLTITCTGGSGLVQGSVFLTLNTNITNKQDDSGLPLNLAVSTNPGSASPVGTTVRLYSSSTLLVVASYTVPTPASQPVVFSVKGLRAAPGMLSNGVGSSTVTLTLVSVGLNMAGAGFPLPIALATTSLLTSNIGNGIPCVESPLPSPLDFSTFATTTSSSTIRLTEGFPGGFAPKEAGLGAGADTGTRIIVRFSGYGSNARIFVPDNIVGSSGTVSTSAGGYGTTVSSGSFTAGGNQLLFSRVNGADANGIGGSAVTTIAYLPPGTNQFTSVSEVPLSGGAGYVLYEVLDGNTNLKEIAQIPVFLVVPQTPCGLAISPPSFTVNLAPVSNVSVGTSTDAIPRYLPVAIGSDCQANNDCSASYFPLLSVDSTPIQLVGSAQGNAKTAAVQISNAGGGVLPFKVTIAYLTGANWLTASPAFGQNNTAVYLTADPSALAVGIYGATVTIDSGAFGTATVSVTFTVGAAGIKITGLANAASFKSVLSPGAYAALFGVNLAGKNVTVTFNGLQASLVYTSATQINLIVPAALGSAVAADVVVATEAGKSDPFKVTLQPSSPGIFNPGIVNFTDGATNDSNHPVARGDIVLIFGTGLAIPVTGQVTVNIGNQTNLIPQFAGAQGSFPALQQINIAVPQTIPAAPNPVPLSFCVPLPNSALACSNVVNLYIK